MTERSEIDNMARLIAIMNGQAPKPVAGRISTPQSNSGIDPNVAAMKDILTRFTSGVEQITTNLVNESVEDGPLREAMAIEQTDDGAVIGMWRIVAKTDSGRKLYDVIRLDENAPIAADLTIYEAARGVAHALNDGVPFTSREMRELLKIEEEYANAVHDAIHAKGLLREKKNKLTESRRSILDDKYGQAIRRAQNARTRLNHLVERFPFQ